MSSCIELHLMASLSASQRPQQGQRTTIRSPLPMDSGSSTESKRDGVRNLYLMRLSDRTEQALTNVPVGHAAMHAFWQPG